MLGFPFHFFPLFFRPTGRGLSGTKPRLTRSHKTATQLRHMICQPTFRAPQAIAATKWVSRPSSHTFSYISSHSFQFVSNASSSTSSIRSRLLNPSFLDLPAFCLPHGPEFNLVCKYFVFLQDIHPGAGLQRAHSLPICLCLPHTCRVQLPSQFVISLSVCVHDKDLWE